jgi:hypothetical protein
MHLPAVAPAAYLLLVAVVQDQYLLDGFLGLEGWQCVLALFGGRHYLPTPPMELGLFRGLAWPGLGQAPFGPLPRVGAF